MKTVRHMFPVLFALLLIPGLVAVGPPASAAGDAAGPVVSEVTVPGSVVAGEQLTVTWRLTDETGVSSATAWITGPTGSSLTGRSGLMAQRDSGSATDGVYRQTCMVPAAAPDGTYKVRIQASDTIGNQTPFVDSHATFTMTGGAPVQVPNPPPSVSAVPGDGAATVSWLAPDDGGSPITGYTATSSAGGRTCSTSGATTCTVSGLTNGTSYAFTVTATNAVGTSVPSVPSPAVTPRTVPGAPAGVTAQALSNSATVSWPAPASNGGAPITGYSVVSSPGTSRCTTTGSTSCTVTGLTNGTSYTFVVYAENVAGTSPASVPSASVTPNLGMVSVQIRTWTVTVTVPDFVWTGHDCQFLPVTVSVQGTNIFHWSVGADARLSGSGTVSSSMYAYGNSAGTVVDDGFFHCPNLDPNGVYNVAGEIEITADDTLVDYTATFATTYTSAPMATTTLLTTTQSGENSLVVEGRVIAHSRALGDVGVRQNSHMALEVQQGAVWVTANTGYTDQLGSFSIEVSPPLPAGSSYRAAFLGSTSSAPSSSAVQTVPGPPDSDADGVIDSQDACVGVPGTIANGGCPMPVAAVKVKAKSGKSKLYVDVNPNKGRGYWRFQVQLKRTDGSWKPLKTDKTKGSKETRTLNLKKGTYRVWVNPKYGYQGVLSAEVYLKK